MAKLQELQTDLHLLANGAYDVEGNHYKVVKVGDQIWMADNLRTRSYRNGDTIPQITVGAEWIQQDTGAFCWLENDSITFDADYGKFYNYYAAVDPRGLCPTGWHVPSQVEWETLFDYAGGSGIAGGKLKETGFTHWQSPNTGATNEYGWDGRAVGFRQSGSLGGFFGGEFKQLTIFWSTTVNFVNSIYTTGLYYQSASAPSPGNASERESGNSVRCLKDK